MNIDQLLLKIYTFILNPFIAVLFVVATVYFLIGLIRYFLPQGSDSDRQTGQRHMVWGLVGMFIMITVFGIMKLIVNTFGVNLSDFGATLPSNY
ncbi:MAG: hypothetical protein WCT49_02785 [Candidatus Paceibacterota bacterium]|jgi:hypothetical protein|nr:hypothetical protein [Candidatus Paceibacterota bacterium]